MTQNKEGIYIAALFLGGPANRQFIRVHVDAKEHYFAIDTPYSGNKDGLYVRKFERYRRVLLENHCAPLVNFVFVPSDVTNAQAHERFLDLMEDIKDDYAINRDILAFAKASLPKQQSAHSDECSTTVEELEALKAQIQDKIGEAMAKLKADYHNDFAHGEQTAFFRSLELIQSRLNQLRMEADPQTFRDYIQLPDGRIVNRTK